MRIDSEKNRSFCNLKIENIFVFRLKQLNKQYFNLILIERFLLNAGNKKLNFHRIISRCLNCLSVVLEVLMKIDREKWKDSPRKRILEAFSVNLELIDL